VTATNAMLGRIVYSGVREFSGVSLLHRPTDVRLNAAAAESILNTIFVGTCSGGVDGLPVRLSSCGEYESKLVNQLRLLSASVDIALAAAAAAAAAARRALSC